MPDSSVLLSGEFAVDANGSATYTIPLKLPPGTNGLHPTLSLAYSSASGLGLAGMGWSLCGLSTITRVARNVAQDGRCAPVHLANDDAYALDGNRLVLVSEAPIDWAAVAHGRKITDFPAEAYRTEIESGRLAVPHYEDKTNLLLSWTVFTKEGLRLDFGGTADARATVPQSGGSAPVRVWALNRVMDRRGNYYTVAYDGNGHEDPLPKSIYYTANDAAKLVAKRKVDFGYDPTDYHEPRYAGGVDVAPTMRLKSITTSASGTVALTWSLTYQKSPSTGRPLVSTVEAPTGDIAFSYTFSSARPLSPPAQGLVWHAGQIVTSDNAPAPGAVFLGHVGALNFWCAPNDIYFRTQPGSLFIPVDLDGDGSMDFLLVGADAGNKWLVISAMENQGDGTFILRGAAVTGHLWTQFRGLTPLDIDGDGQVELVLMTNVDGRQGLRLLKFASNGTTWTLKTLEEMPTTTLAAPKDDSGQWSLLPIELDGDGFLDLCVSAQNGRDLRLYNSSGGNLWPRNGDNMSPWATGPAEGQVFALDLDGDGRTDFVRVFPDSKTSNLVIQAALCTSLDHGLTSLALRSDSTLDTQLAKLALPYSGGRMIVGDINGDGLVDLVWVQNMACVFRVTVFHNTGAGFLAGDTVDIDALSYDSLKPLFVGAKVTHYSKSGCTFPPNSAEELARAARWEEMAPYKAGRSQFLKVDYQLIDVDGDGRAELVGFATANPRARWTNEVGEDSTINSATYSDVTLDTFCPPAGAAFSVIRLDTKTQASTGTVPPTLATLGTVLNQGLLTGPAYGSAFIPADFTGRGVSGFVVISPDSTTAYLPPPDAGDLPARIVNELSGAIQVNYRPLTDPAVYSRATAARGAQTMERIAGAQFLAGCASLPETLHAPAALQSKIAGSVGSVHTIAMPRAVVSSYLKERAGAPGDETQCFYSGARLDSTGRGWLGFDTTRFSDPAAGTVRETCYSQLSPFIGRVLCTSLQAGAARPAKTEQVAILQGNIMAYRDGCTGRGPHLVQLSGSVEVWTSDPFVCEEKLVDLSYSDDGSSVVASTETLRQFDSPGAPARVVSVLKKNFKFVHRLLDPGTGLAGNKPLSSPDWKSWFVSECVHAEQADASGAVLRQRDCTYLPTGELLTNRDGGSDDHRVTYDYDDFGNRQSVTDSLGACSSVEFDPVHRTFVFTSTAPVKADDKDPITESFEWDAGFGLETHHTNANGSKTLKTYDHLGRPTELFGPKPDDLEAHVLLAKWSYIPGGSGCTVRESTAVDWQGNFVTREKAFDAWQRLVTESVPAPDGSLATKNYSYDSRGQIVAEDLPLVRGQPADSIVRIQRTFDSRGRLAEETGLRADGSVGRALRHLWQSSFDCLIDIKGGPSELIRYGSFAGRRLVVERTADPRGPVPEKTRWNYDALGRLTSVIDAAGVVTATSYDQLDRVTSVTVTDANGKIVQRDVMTYKDAQRQVVRVDQLGNQEERTYDARGHLLSQKVKGGTSDIAGITITHTWDKRSAKGCNRLCAVETTTAATTSVTPATTIREEYVYDACGNQRTTTVTHDDVKKDTTADSTAVPFAFTRSFTPRGAIATVQLHDTGLQTNEYNSCGGLERIRFAPTGGSDSVVAEFEWAGLGQRTVSFANGLRETRQCDPEGRLASWDLHGVDGLIESCAIKRGPLGDPISVGDATYDYDPLQRLRSVRKPSGGGEFDYANGDRIASGGNRATYRAHQLITSREKYLSSLNYDAAGNLSTVNWNTDARPQGPKQTFGYDALNRLTSADGLQDGVKFTAIYDHTGRRARKHIENKKTSRSYTQHTIAPAYEFTTLSNGSQQTQQTVVYIMGPDGPLAQWADGALDSPDRPRIPAGFTFLHRDHLGSISRVTDPHGQILATIGYSPLGAITATPAELAYTPPGTLLADPVAAPTRLGFTGHEYDHEIGLYYCAARYYHPRLGCFIQADDRPGGPIDQGDSYNRYAYAMQRPLTFTDPSGHGIFDILNTIGNFLHIGNIGDWARAAWKPVTMFFVSAGLIVAGACIMGLSGGIATTVGSSLMGAGVSGAVYFYTNMDHDLSWSDWGVQLGIGAATGLVTGAGSAAGTIAAMNIARLTMGSAVQIGLNVAAGIGSGAMDAVLNNVAHHDSITDGLALAMVTGGILGAIGGRLDKLPEAGPLNRDASAFAQLVDSAKRSFMKEIPDEAARKIFTAYEKSWGKVLGKTFYKDLRGQRT